MPLLLIGLTGGVGAGKSTAAAVMIEEGAAVVSGDELGRRVLEGSPALLDEVRRRYGDDVFRADGSLDRRALGARVFASAVETRWLTDLTFPAIYALWRDAVASSGRDVVVFDAALIFEWGIESEFDLIVLVTAAREQAIQRMAVSGRLHRDEVERRIAAQIPAEIKLTKANVMLANDASLDDFRGRTRGWWRTCVEPELTNRRAERDESSR